MATQVFINNFKTTLAATFGAGDTTLQLTSAAGLPVLTGDQYYLLTIYHLAGVEESGHEVLKVTARTGLQCTVERAYEGAAASEFLAGAGSVIEARATADAFAKLATDEALTTGLSLKADLTYVDTALAGKASNASVALKADQATTYTKTETDAAIATGIDAVIDASPGALDTLNELAAALGDDPNFAATMTTALAGKQAKLSTAGNDYKVPMLAAGKKFSIRNYADNDDMFTVFENGDGVSLLNSLSIDAYGQDATIGLNTTLGNYGSVSFRRVGVDRWFFGMSNAAEGGSDAGSNFFIGSFSDAGAFLSTCIAINRATGVTDFGAVPTAGGVNLVTRTSTDTLTNKTLTTPTIDGYTEGSVTASGTSFSPDISTDTVFGYATTGNATTTLPAPAAGKSFEIHYTYGGAHTLSFLVTGGSTLLWDGGAAPTFAPANTKTDIITFRCTKLNGTLQWVAAKIMGGF